MRMRITRGKCVYLSMQQILIVLKIYLFFFIYNVILLFLSFDFVVKYDLSVFLTGFMRSYETSK